MDNIPLTITDLDILLEAMSSWEQKDVGSDIIETLLSSMIEPGLPEEGKLALSNINKRRDNKRQQEFENRKETAILLKAKLIQIKHGIVVAEANAILNKS
jgi:hypothetical protein